MEEKLTVMFSGETGFCRKREICRVNKGDLLKCEMVSHFNTTSF
jgi:hypothetical protein